MSYSFADSLRAGSGRSVQFYSKNNFEKLVHLFGFIIRLYHDARSPERQRTSNTYYVISNNIYLKSVRKIYKNKTPNFNKKKAV